MIRYFLIIFFVIISASAEVVVTEGTYTYTGEISKNEACSLAKERAKLKALEKVLGQTISSDEMENCSEVDGEYNCERNKFSLFQLNGDLTDSKIIKKNYDKEIGTEILFCEITIEAKGGHAALPHMGVDAITVGSQIAVALQTIVSRKLDPVEAGVVSVTEFITDGKKNVLPGNGLIKGDARAFSKKTNFRFEGKLITDANMLEQMPQIIKKG